MAVCAHFQCNGYNKIFIISLFHHIYAFIFNLFHVIFCSRNVSSRRTDAMKKPKCTIWMNFLLSVYPFFCYFFVLFCSTFFRCSSNFEMHGFQSVVITRSLCHCGFQVLTLSVLFMFVLYFVVFCWIPATKSTHTHTHYTYAYIFNWMTVLFQVNIRLR